MVAEESPVLPAQTLRELAPRQPLIDAVAIGASAGGVEALTAVVSQLSRDFTAAVLVVLHVAETGRSLLPVILDRSGQLPAAGARDGAPIEPGHIYVAPSGSHLTVDGGRMRVSSGPHENGHRPAVDPLFRTAARAYGPRLAGVVLSGARDDGTAGLREVKQHGGVAIVQDPREAIYAGMPHSAMTHVAVDAVLSRHEIGFALARLAGETVTSDPARTPAVDARPADAPPLEPADAWPLTCPECGGVLLESRAGTVGRFTCRVGHAYSLQSLYEEQTRHVEAAMWAAVCSLEERSILLRRMERHSHDAGGVRMAQTFARRAHEMEERAQAICGTLQELVAGWRADEAEPVEEPVERVG